MGSNSVVRNLSVVDSGLNICQLRVLQSYTTFAKHDRIGRSSSHYLSSRFMDETENCFAEVLGRVEQFGGVFSFFSKGLLNQLNQIQNNVHWFHSSLKKEKGLLSQTQTTGVGGKFSEVEKKKNTISSQLMEQREKIYFFNKVIGWPLVLFSFALSLSLFSFFKSFFNFNKELVGLDEKAQVIIYKGENWNSLELQELVTKSLEVAKLPSLAEVARRWSRYTDLKNNDNKQISKEVASIVSEKNETKRDLEQDLSSKNFQREEQLSTSPITFSEVKSDDLGPSLDQSVTRMVELLASKIFTSGINFQILIDENSKFIADQSFNDYLDQIILSLLQPIISMVGKLDDNNKKITLTSSQRKNPETGEAFIDMAIATMPSLLLSEEEFAIPLSLLKEIRGEGKIQSNGTLWIEFPLEIYFVKKDEEKIETKGSKLVHLFRGRKRDLLKDFGI